MSAKSKEDRIMADKKIINSHSRNTHRHSNHHNRHKPHNHTYQKKKGKDNKILYYIIAALAACLVFCIWTILKNDDSINPQTDLIPANGQITTTNNNQTQDLFVINNFSFTGIDNKDLWSEINFMFDFVGSPDLEQYRDSSGLILVNCYAEYYNQDGAFEISQTHNITVSGDNTYSGNITCFDTTLTVDRISSIVFTVEGFYGSRTVRVNFE